MPFGLNDYGLSNLNDKSIGIVDAVTKSDLI